MIVMYTRMDVILKIIFFGQKRDIHCINLNTLIGLEGEGPQHPLPKVDSPYKNFQSEDRD